MTIVTPPVLAAQPFLTRMEAAQVSLNAPIAAAAQQYSNRILLEAILAGGLGLIAVVASILLAVWMELGLCPAIRLLGELRCRSRATSARVTS